jgi:hypothetical protein
MKKALHMGTMETERAERIFFDDSRRPKRRTTRRARRMLMGRSRGPRAMTDMATMRASKTDQRLARNGRSQLDTRLMNSSATKRMVKMMLRRSRMRLRKVGAPWSKSRSGLYCASATDAAKFCSPRRWGQGRAWATLETRGTHRNDQECGQRLKPT